MKKKVFSLLLALGLMTVGGTASALTPIKLDEAVTIRFDVPDTILLYVSGVNSTSTSTTQAGSYTERHYAENLAAYSYGFTARLVSVKPWYKPNVIKDTDYTVGTVTNRGENRGAFVANEKLRTDFQAVGMNGQALYERSSLYK